MNDCPSSGVEFGSLFLQLPSETAEALARRAAEIVLAELERDQTTLHPFLTTEEAAEYLRCSRQRIYDLRSAGRLARLADGGRALISRAELDALVGLRDKPARTYDGEDN